MWTSSWLTLYRIFWPQENYPMHFTRNAHILGHSTFLPKMLFRNRRFGCNESFNEIFGDESRSIVVSPTSALWWSSILGFDAMIGFNTACISTASGVWISSLIVTTTHMLVSHVVLSRTLMFPSLGERTESRPSTSLSGFVPNWCLFFGSLLDGQSYSVEFISLRMHFIFYSIRWFALITELYLTNFTVASWNEWVVLHTILGLALNIDGFNTLEESMKRKPSQVRMIAFTLSRIVIFGRSI